LQDPTRTSRIVGRNGQWARREVAMREAVVGVLGGMGPDATARLLLSAITLPLSGPAPVQTLPRAVPCDVCLQVLDERSKILRQLKDSDAVPTMAEDTDVAYVEHSPRLATYCNPLRTLA
jgi:hypothetical protein